MKASLVVMLSAVFLLLGCSRTVANRAPVGEVFPTVSGESLEGQAYTLPGELEGPTVLLLGYVQNSQFDIDRWILGMMQLQTPVNLLEIPTMEGVGAEMFSGVIDDGMRSGIPEEDWGAVVTVYDDAEAIIDFTGNENPRNARVLLLNEEGTVVWFHDRGYSGAKMMVLDAAVRQLATRSR